MQVEAAMLRITPTTHTWAVIVACLFVVFTLCFSLYLLFEHLSSYNGPEEQKWLIGIIFMVPVYSLTSFLSLWSPAISRPCNTFGDCYEAFAMYSFGCYLIACLGEEDMAVEKLARQGSLGSQTPLLNGHLRKHMVYHPIPLRWCIEPWELGRPFYDIAKFGIVQYMILKTVCSWLALLLEELGSYKDGEFDWSTGYPYIVLVLNFSQMWALYCLVQFYQVTKQELHEINPLAKFLCFKAVVFVTWWQGVIIALIFSSGLAFQWFSSEAILAGHLKNGLQDFIICIEMAIAAVAHVFVYPATPYQRVGNKEQSSNSFGIITEAVDQSNDLATPSVKESMRDVVFGGGGQVVEDVKITMSQAVEPFETGITMIHETFHETIQSWGGKHKKMITEEETYLIKGEDDSRGNEEAGILKTQVVWKIAVETPNVPWEAITAATEGL